MVDVSNTIINGDWVLTPLPLDNKLRIEIRGFTTHWLTIADARDLWQVLNVWVERTAKEAE